VWRSRYRAWFTRLKTNTISIDLTENDQKPKRALLQNMMTISGGCQLDFRTFF
jgi:hypothetical protein